MPPSTAHARSKDVNSVGSPATLTADLRPLTSIADLGPRGPFSRKFLWIHKTRFGKLFAGLVWFASCSLWCLGLLCVRSRLRHHRWFAPSCPVRASASAPFGQTQKVHHRVWNCPFLFEEIAWARVCTSAT